MGYRSLVDLRTQEKIGGVTGKCRRTGTPDPFVLKTANVRDIQVIAATELFGQTHVLLYPAAPRSLHRNNAANLISSPLDVPASSQQS
jgi:hypothetical protein